MRFHPFEVSIPHIIYAALGGFVVIFGMFSLFIRERLYIGEACWAFLFGVVIGPYGANIFDPRSWGNGDDATVNTITLEFTRVVLAIGVFAIGVELPKAYMKRHWKSLFFLLFPVMTWGWFVSAALIYALIPGLNFLSSLAVAACLTPTDPILAAAVVGGKYADKHVPAHLRHLLAAESGCNDGAAYPFLFIALYLIIDRNTGNAISDWFLLLWLYQVILGIVMGAIIGIGFRHLMKFCERKDLIDRQSYVAQYVSLAMLTIGSCSLLGTDDLLAAFSCGTAFAWDGFFNRQTEEAVFSSVIDLLFNIAAFVFVGAWMPFNQFSDPTLSLSVWRLIVIAILVLILRRLPAMIALYKWIPDVKTFREAVFSGHFGPMGVGAIFISTLAAEQLAHPHDPPENQEELLAATIQPIVAFMVLCSITIHGLSIPFFSLGRRVHSVSRTWSRHDTFGRHPSMPGLPEWANQTQHVERGQDIVVNRDIDIEQGKLALDEKNAARSRRESLTAHGSSSSDAEKEGDFSTTPSPSSDDKEERAPGSQGEHRGNARDIREQNLPDGDEKVAVWREGPDKIIERRNGPGEEVEVEVLKNVYAHGDTHRNTFSVSEGAMHDAKEEIKKKLSRSPEEIHPVEGGLVHAIEEIGRKVSDAESKVKQAVGSGDSPRQSRPGTAGTMENSASDHSPEEEEGWMSDQEVETASTTSKKSKSKSPKSKPPKLNVSRPLGSPSGSRRRQSFRRGVLANIRSHGGRSASDGQIIVHPPEDDDAEDHRGRRSTPRHEARPTTPNSPTLATPSSPRSIRHRRIDSLRSLRPESRELSPSRSIRWADEQDIPTV
ncbi:hypothetical protein QCA50_019295 [Cerrena zonata]|uniref:Cation/H+ exchanger transmembrane domain-containing protein n=1 Tax=Cerrena zonata TaxID=2478898 RepID=A0AAW0FAY6_9APHY